MKNPNLIPTPFAQDGQRDDIPATHTSELANQKATWDVGFPPITMLPVTAGGLPPSGRDFNGVLNQISENIVHLSKGGKFKFSTKYTEQIGGYPKGAILQSDDESKEYQSLIDNNKINFNIDTPDHIDTAWKLVNTSSLIDNLNKKFNKSDVSQATGQSTIQVMSQKAVTDAINNKQDKGDYATNAQLNTVSSELNKSINAANTSATNANNNANTRLSKSQNGADIPDKNAFVKNLGLVETVNKANNAYPKSGGIVNGYVDATGYISGKGVYEAPGIRVYSSINKPSPGELGAYTITESNSLIVPVGVPLPYPHRYTPQGYLTCNGQTFDKSLYPKLAEAYPAGRVPDLRGEFIRGWDDSRGVDPGRVCGTWQGDSTKRIQLAAGYGNENSYLWTYQGAPSGYKYPLGRDAIGNATDTSIANNTSGHETRPRNIAFNYIVRAA
ncbi:phage tail protein [Photorhabdus temperata]|uniref:Phage-related tail fiber protein n=1 Tax=Photorhabdus temperata subsp. temperata Meg1 TaxID=1393735 RepID=A0A081RXK9_PHOTE|nr:phage tail protein [Photorhabdus temperata]KER03412.1 phage-related tail fiber protein [Photorhabdus temperata subsp. temperata Meg1]